MWLSWCKSLREEMAKATAVSSNETAIKEGAASEDQEPEPLWQIWHGDFWNEERGSQKHRCSECDECFSTRLSLSTHMKLHQRPICYICCQSYSDDEDLVGLRIYPLKSFIISSATLFQDDHVAQCHKAPPKVPQNSPVVMIKVKRMSTLSDNATPTLIDFEKGGGTALDDVVSEDSGFQTPDRTEEVSFKVSEDASTPKRGATKRPNSSRSTNKNPPLVKRITTRSGRQISMRNRDD